MIQQPNFWMYIQGKENRISKSIYTLVFIEALLTIHKARKRSVHQQRDGHRVCGMPYTMKYLAMRENDILLMQHEWIVKALC